MQRVGALAVALLLPCCGGVALIGAFGDATPKTQPLADPVAEQLAGEPTTPAPAETAAQAAIAEAQPTGTQAVTTPPAPAGTTAAAAPPPVTRKSQDWDSGESCVRVA